MKSSQKLGPLDYELRLPTSMKALHPIFHVSLLSPYKVSPIKGREIPPPQPIEIEGYEEFVVEKILDSRYFRRQFQYLIKWEGYSDSKNS